MMNPGNFSLIALMLSVFVGGAYLRGEISRKQELKDELRSMKEKQQLTMAQVDSVNARYERDRAMMMAKTIEFYGRLDTILQQKFVNTKQIRTISNEIRQERNNLDMETQALRVAARQRITILPPEPEPER